MNSLLLNRAMVVFAMQMRTGGSLDLFKYGHTLMRSSVCSQRASEEAPWGATTTTLQRKAQ
jgi:hypothetical protein